MGNGVNGVGETSLRQKANGFDRWLLGEESRGLGSMLAGGVGRIWALFGLGTGGAEMELDGSNKYGGLGLVVVLT